MMHRTLLFGLFLLLSCLGCEGVIGPMQRRCLREPINNPCLPIDEQERIGRERLALPEAPNVAPDTGVEPPGYRNRRGTGW